MSNESDTSFRERVEEIREERSSGGQGNSSQNRASQGDSDQSFQEKVEEIRRERKTGERGSFSEETTPQVQWGIVAGVFLVGGIMGVIWNPAQPVSGFFVVGLVFGGVAWVFATESGKKFRELSGEIMEEMNDIQQQQQQSKPESGPKKICPNCGWKNPKGNNYCHDCGEKLDQG